ncbi:MAG: heavy metal-binding domain-containing protein [Byssovorax sp.]
MANQPPGYPGNPQPRPLMADLPQHARERIERTRGAQGQRFFTSDLSVNEFLLVREIGFEPAGLVMGSSIFHVGYQRGSWSENQELTVLTQAMYQARELAMARMEEEVEALGADGVIGVRLKVNRHAFGEHMVEFLAIGTAIVARENGRAFRMPNGKAFSSDLSGQDFWTLLHSGYRPVSMVMGNCVYHVAHQSLGGWFKTVGQNVEMVNFTQALYDARELAMERLQYEAQMDGAIGVVGTEITESSHGWESHIIEFFAVGTSVLPLQGAPALPKPELVLTVNE